MTLRHMKIFTSVCENGYNTTKAAQELHMTQPAVSLAIRELEDHYGVALFDRLGRRLQITEAGKTFLRYAIHITTMFEEAETNLHDWDSQGILRIGASITIGSQFLPEYVKTFLTLYPGVEAFVKIMDSEKLQEMVLKNIIDFALIEGIPTDPTIVSEDYMEDTLTVAGAADGTWQQGQHITIEEFRRQRILLREQGSGSRRVFDQALEKAGFAVTPAWESMSTIALINAASNGLGLGVIPSRLAAEYIERGKIVCLNIDGLDFRRSFRIIHHKDKLITPSMAAFLDLCRNYEEDYPLPV